MWPRVARVSDRKFVANTHFNLEDDNGTQAEPIMLKTRTQRSANNYRKACSSKTNLKVPDTVRVSAGTFYMGTEIIEIDELKKNIKISRRYEGPQLEVTIEHDFLVGKYPITYDEFDCFVEDCKANHTHWTNVRTQCRIDGINVVELPSPPEGHGWGRGRHPVVSVSWYDAQVYVAWLSLYGKTREVTDGG